VYSKQFDKRLTNCFTIPRDERKGKWRKDRVWSGYSH